jgi:peptidoglycan hydrolase-like protein with peptidoglycan-binding domain
VKRQAGEEARQKLLAEEAAQKKALENDKTHAAEVETALRLSLAERQRIQVALTALGFDTNGTDGVFSQRTHNMIAAWQKSRAYPETGYVTAAQSQELLRAAPAAPPQPQATPPVATPQVAANSADGQWTGTYQCAPNNVVGSFTLQVHVTVQGSHGLQVMPNVVPSSGSRSFEVVVNGKDVIVRRATGVNTPQLLVNTLAARFDGGVITGQGLESTSKRTCQVLLRRG